MQGVYSCNRNMWKQAPGEAGLRATHCRHFLGEPDLGDGPTSQALCVLRRAGVWGKPAFQWRVILNLNDVFLDVVSVFQISCKRGLSHSGWVGPPLLLHLTCLPLPTDQEGVGGRGCCQGQVIGWGSRQAWASPTSKHTCCYRKGKVSHFPLNSWGNCSHIQHQPLAAWQRQYVVRMPLPGCKVWSGLPFRSFQSFGILGGSPWGSGLFSLVRNGVKWPWLSSLPK